MAKKEGKSKEAKEIARQEQKFVKMQNPSEVCKNLKGEKRDKCKAKAKAWADNYQKVNYPKSSD